MGRVRTIRSDSSEPRTYGSTRAGSLARGVCQFLDNNRHEVLTVNDVLIKFGLRTSATGKEVCDDERSALRKLTKLLNVGWLSYDELLDEEGRPAYGPGPRILDMSVPSSRE